MELVAAAVLVEIGGGATERGSQLVVMWSVQYSIFQVAQGNLLVELSLLSISFRTGGVSGYAGGGTGFNAIVEVMAAAAVTHQTLLLLLLELQILVAAAVLVLKVVVVPLVVLVLL